MSSTEDRRGYDTDQRASLLDLAASSIRHGLDHGHPLEPILEDYPEPLRKNRASFVTLEIGQDLRGCIGALEAYQPLVRDVAEHAFAAAFQDPRFPPLSAAEYPRLSLHISVLSPPAPLEVASEADLLAQLRPGEDGLIVLERGHRGTFLPSVWEQLPDPRDFLRHLKRKAGLPPDHWSDSIRFQRYTTESFGRDAPLR